MAEDFVFKKEKSQTTQALSLSTFKTNVFIALVCANRLTTLTTYMQSTGEHIEKTGSLLASQMAAFAMVVLDQPACEKETLPEDCHSCPIDFMNSPGDLAWAHLNVCAHLTQTGRCPASFIKW